MKIAVSGATGFIGRSAVRELAAGGHDVVILGRDEARARALFPALAFRRFELASAPSGALLDGVAAVVHLAAYLPARYDDPAEAEACLRHNALGTLALAQAAERAAVEHFVNVSSGNAYAPQPRPIREDDPVSPQQRATYYLASKLCAELFVQHAAATSARLRAVCLRPASVYGPGMAPRGLLPTLLARLGAGEPVSLADGGRHTADFVYVGDVSQAIRAALEKPASGVFNVGSGALHSARELADQVLRVLGAAPSLVRVEPAAATPAPGFGVLDIDKARRELGYRPTSLEQGLRRTLEQR